MTECSDQPHYRCTTAYNLCLLVIHRGGWSNERGCESACRGSSSGALLHLPFFLKGKTDLLIRAVAIAEEKEGIMH